ncbi:TPA: hypothetical protein J1285_004888 [Escherichia coli]|uniref:F4 family fimbrial subunit n=1 Tax=Escherichia coli TaxID=562 RepID=UPI00038FAE61|nr:hypothetical protein [Escherichia coli]HBN3988422.1 hypothetical protein [Escherichia coli O25b:H4-ST131]EEW8305948.1 hypothetical protein [Escherichia coli]EGX9356930.1 hypothetical protein [Escherichia coli]EHX8000030.1 hypothetical protein [Escherichia coli]EKA4251987.1 hypothetical protein [Escherichia coli]
MKKTLIALAVAASAAVSGSAMAWTANGTGGSVDLGGTLTPVTKATPWEVETGGSVTGLDGQVQKGQREVSISVKNAIPVLGIRNADENGFKGQNGIKPQIDYKGAVDIDGFKNGVTTVYMEVRGESGDKIGSLEAPFYAAAALTYKNHNGMGSKLIAASDSSGSFFGGLGKSTSAIMSSGGYERLESMYPKLVEKFTVASWKTAMVNEGFTDTAVDFWSVYGGGIEKNSTIKITLDQAASGDAPIKWKSNLPVTVTYM